MPYKKLKLKINFLKNKKLIMSFKKLTKIPPKLIVNPELLTFITSIGIIAQSSIILYYDGKNSSSRIHIDDEGITDQANLNYVIDTGNAVANWYTPVGNYTGVITDNGITKMVSYDATKMKLIDRVCIKEECLFQGGIPHNVSNLSSERWCVSIKLRNEKFGVVTWNQALNLFNKFIA